MAWSTYPTFVANDPLTAAEMNAYVRDDGNILKTSIDDLGNISLPTSQELTIATGAITVVQNHHGVDTESDAAADDLDTVTPGTDIEAGCLLILVPQNFNRVVTIKHGTGNINLDGGVDFVMNSESHRITLHLVGTDWYELSRVPQSGAVRMLSAPVNKADAQSVSLAQGWDTAVTLDLGSDCPAGAQAALLTIEATDAVGAMIRVRAEGSSGEYVASAFADNVSQADSDGHPNSQFVICPVDASGDIEYQIGNANAGATTVGGEVWIHGYIEG